MQSGNSAQSQASLMAALQQIKEIAESALSGQQPSVIPAIIPKQSSARKDSSSTQKVTLRDHLLKLRESGFFKEPRTTDDIHQKLQTTYSCHRDRVITALWRMVKSHELRKTSVVLDKEKQTAYVW